MRVRPCTSSDFTVSSSCKRVSRAVGFQRPDFHFAETLAAVLRLAAQRLLRDERVRTDRAGVDLVRDQVAELHHVDVADDDFLIEGVAGAAVEQPRLAVFLHPGEAVDLLRVLQVLADLRLPRCRRRPASRP